jgi:hypothetical protein
LCSEGARRAEPAATSRRALLVATKWRLPLMAKGNFNMVTKSLTMIKRWLPFRFLLMRQTDRMRYGSMM